jgi:hypothetical protein
LVTHETKVTAAESAWGFTAEDMAGRDPDVEIWPDNESAVKVFAAMGTQWRVGMAGRTGLDYGVLPLVFRLTDIPRADWPHVFDDLRVMEGAALSHMHKD